MNNKQFTIRYNGQDVAVTCLGNKSYYVQITYKPLKLEEQQDENGATKWIDSETKLETNLTSAIGQLISSEAVESMGQ